MTAPCRSDQYRYRACTGKVQHATRAEAEHVAEKQAAKWRVAEPVRLNVYLCPFCRRFHIGREYKE